MNHIHFRNLQANERYEDHPEVFLRDEGANGHPYYYQGRVTGSRGRPGKDVEVYVEFGDDSANVGVKTDGWFSLTQLCVLVSPVGGEVDVLTQPVLPTDKTLNNSDIKGARTQVADIEIVGNGDMFQLLCKASSKKEGWMKSTKAMSIPGVGCVVQVTTQQGDQVAEAATFVPNVRIVADENGGRRLEVQPMPTLTKS